jgi:hypothetical protein
MAFAEMETGLSAMKFGFMEGSQEFAGRSAGEGLKQPQSAITMKSRPRFYGVGFDRRSLAVASGACGRKVVEVQILSSAPLLSF